MKNKIYLLTLLLSIGLFFNSCETNTEDYKSVSPVDSFVTTSMSVEIPQTATSYSFDITVQASEAYTADRSVPIEVASSSTAGGLQYSFTGNVDMVKGAVTGTTTLDLDVDLVSSDTEKTIVLKLVSTGEEITITFIKECIANAVVVFIDFDNFSSETSWDIRDSSSTIVASSGGNYPGGTDSTIEEYLLPSGTYTFTIYDAFSDGICCGWGNGSYLVSGAACGGGAVYASGASFGSSESTMFTVP